LTGVFHVRAGHDPEGGGPVLRCHYERLKRGWNQQDAARASGIPQTTISAIERGRVVPTSDELDALARAFDITPSRVLLKPTVVVHDPEEVAEEQHA
jgi:transcriptional regulator with XRE-family HTH domain